MNNSYDPSNQNFGPNPYEQPTGYTLNGHPRPVSQLSAMAVMSLVLAIISPFMICLCFPSFLSSLGAVVFGHIALYRISKSYGQLGGRTAAILGLIFGYPVLLITGALMPSMISGIREGRRNAENAADTATEDPTAASALAAAERDIISSNEGIAYGNNEHAIILAENFSLSMKRMREVLFTEGEDHAISLTDGEFVTYCELRDDSCAFLVHVPDYRNFESDAKDSLAELAWMAAQETVDGVLSPDDKLAVGMKGVLVYGAVMKGVVGESFNEMPDPQFKGKDKDMLLEFFEPEVPAGESEQPDQPDEMPSQGINGNAEGGASGEASSEAAEYGDNVSEDNSPDENASGESTEEARVEESDSDSSDEGRKE